MRGDLGIQSKLSIISRHTAGLLFASLCCLIFILALKQVPGAAGKEDKPLIGGDVTTLSPYGARNSAELLSNLHNMLGI